jgi:hypothetical protein
MSPLPRRVAGVKMWVAISWNIHMNATRKTAVAPYPKGEVALLLERLTPAPHRSERSSDYSPGAHAPNRKMDRAAAQGIIEGPASALATGTGAAGAGQWQRNHLE